MRSVERIFFELRAAPSFRQLALAFTQGICFVCVLTQPGLAAVSERQGALGKNQADERRLARARRQ